ncbi:MAG: TVP38/TMEM64 family protein, partial [Actinomycetota bacterium]|nr:TVP38/TMEM64 family protein [Actinomycetota bacterium]
MLASPVARLAMAVVALLTLFVFLASQDLLSPARIRGLVRQAPVAAPVVFVLLYAALTVLLIPGAVRSLLAGALFGPVWGTVLTVVAATIGASAAFLIARSVGRAHVERIAGPRITQIDRWITDRGLGAVLFVRLVPLFPFNTVNYAAGLTGLRLRTFAFGTLVGVIPGTTAYVGLG